MNLIEHLGAEEMQEEFGALSVLAAIAGREGSLSLTTSQCNVRTRRPNKKLWLTLLPDDEEKEERHLAKPASRTRRPSGMNSKRRRNPMHNQTTGTDLETMDLKRQRLLALTCGPLPITGHDREWTGISAAAAPSAPPMEQPFRATCPQGQPITRFSCQPPAPPVSKDQQDHTLISDEHLEQPGNAVPADHLHQSTDTAMQQASSFASTQRQELVTDEVPAEVLRQPWPVQEPVVRQAISQLRSKTSVVLQQNRQLLTQLAQEVVQGSPVPADGRHQMLAILSQHEQMLQQLTATVCAATLVEKHVAQQAAIAAPLVSRMSCGGASGLSAGCTASFATVAGMGLQRSLSGQLSASLSTDACTSSGELAYAALAPQGSTSLPQQLYYIPAASQMCLQATSAWQQCGVSAAAHKLTTLIQQPMHTHIQQQQLQALLMPASAAASTLHSVGSGNLDPATAEAFVTVKLAAAQQGKGSAAYGDKGSLRSMSRGGMPVMMV